MRNLRDRPTSYLLFSAAAAGFFGGALARQAWRWAWRPQVRVEATATRWEPRRPEPSKVEVWIEQVEGAPRRRGIRIATALLIAVVLVATAASALLWQQKAKSRREWAENLTRGSVDRAVTLMSGNGCGGCHQIPGVPGAAGDVGPPLAGISRRAYLGGAIANSPDNLASWIRDARSIDPHSAMPTTAITQQDARDIAAYLYTLE